MESLRIINDGCKPVKEYMESEGSDHMDAQIWQELWPQSDAWLWEDTAGSPWSISTDRAKIPLLSQNAELQVRKPEQSSSCARRAWKQAAGKSKFIYYALIGTHGLWKPLGNLNDGIWYLFADTEFAWMLTL